MKIFEPWLTTYSPMWHYVSYIVMTQMQVILIDINKSNLIKSDLFTYRFHVQCISRVLQCCIGICFAIGFSQDGKTYNDVRMFLWSFKIKLTNKCTYMCEFKH